MPKLYVSYNCGVTYRDALESDDLAKLEAAGRRYDEQALRWYIEDDNGEMAACSTIHQQTFAFLESLAQRNEDAAPEPFNPPRPVDDQAQAQRRQAMSDTPIVQRVCKDVSLVRRNAEAAPNYRPYCLRCSGLRRMERVEPFFWRCRCGAEHDEREPTSAATAAE